MELYRGDVYKRQEHVVGQARERKEKRQLGEELPEAYVEKRDRAQKTAAHEHRRPPGTPAFPSEVGYAEGHDGVCGVEQGQPLRDVGDEREVQDGQEILQRRLGPVFPSGYAQGGPDYAAAQQPQEMCIRERFRCV